MTASITIAPVARVSPAATAMIAAIAPSVEAIGATTPTLPIESPAYSRSSPRTLPIPATASHARMPRSTPAGTPVATRAGSVTTRPTTMTQARTELAGIVRLDREEQIVVVAHMTAAPRPPKIASTAPPSASVGPA